MLINLSNHPSDKWSDEQRKAATSQFGDIIDISFPEIDPSADIESITFLARDFLNRCIVLVNNGNELKSAVHVAGEACFIYQFVNFAQKQGLACVSSTTRRIVRVSGTETIKTFQFVQFREYY